MAAYALYSKKYIEPSRKRNGCKSRSTAPEVLAWLDQGAPRAGTEELAVRFLLQPAVEVSA
jgi:hypothetical protein